jgi:hypothetical protein
VDTTPRVDNPGGSCNVCGMTNPTAAAFLASVDWDAPDPDGERMARENDTPTLTARHLIVINAYQRAVIGKDTPDAAGNVWGEVAYLDDMWPGIVEEINGRDAVLAVVLDLAARTEGEFSSVVTDEFGETTIVFEAGIVG